MPAMFVTHTVNNDGTLNDLETKVVLAVRDMFS